MALTFEQFKELRARGLSPEQIAKFESGQKPVAKQTGVKGFLNEQFGGLQAVARGQEDKSLMGKASNFLFGSTAKTVGSLMGSGYGATKSLLGQITGNEEMIRSGQKLEDTFGGLAAVARGTAKTNEITPTNIAFTTLELYPGGGVITNILKKLPGGSQSLKYITETLAKVPASIRGSAVKNMSEVLRPTTKATKAMTEQVAPELVKRKVVSGSVSGLLNRSKAELTKVGDAFDEVLSKIDGGKEFKIQPLQNTLESLKSNFYVKDRAGKIKIGTSGNPIAINQNVLNTIDELQGILREFGDNISFDSMRSLRQILDKEVAQSGGFLKTLKEGAELDIKKNLSNSIRNILAKESPDLAKLNAEFSFWKKTEDILKATKARQTGKPISLGAKATSVIGAATGGLKWAVLAPLLEKAFTSAAWKTSSALLKNNLADALVSGNNKVIFETLKRFGIGIKNQE